jgi:alpha-1,3-rhamnosyl/mannosyltransferase
MPRDERPAKAHQASLPERSTPDRDEVYASGLRIAIDMTFPNRNRAGSGVYARALIAALHKTGEVSLEEIAAPQGEGSLSTLAWLGVGARRALVPGSFDVVHCPAYVAAPRLPVPLVLNIHDAAAWRFPKDYPLVWRIINRFLVPAVAQRAACVIALSEFSRSEIARFYRVPRRRIALVPAAAQEHYRPPPPRDVEKYRASLGGGPPILLFVGAPIARKNLDLALDVLAQTVPGSPLESARLLISGAHADSFPHYAARIAEKGLEGRVRWLGPVPEAEMPLLYAAADLLIYPSRYEGFGLPPIESMSVGTPVVASNATCLPEVLGDGALLLDPDDVPGFAHATEMVLTNAELREKLARLGKRQASRYTWQRCAEKTIDIYRRVARRSKGKTF